MTASERPAVPAPSEDPAYERRSIRDGELCARCGHRYAVHALGKSECVRYVKGHRCTCREFARGVPS